MKSNNTQETLITSEKLESSNVVSAKATLKRVIFHQLRKDENSFTHTDK